MNRDEAIAHDKEMNETQHSMKRRCNAHDYRRVGTYMLTLVVEGREPLLGVLRGNAEAPKGAPDAPRVECSKLGEAILRDEIQKITQYYPQVEVWKCCIMPDHIHLIVRVREDLPEGKHLGLVVAGFKGGCSKAAMGLGVTEPRASVRGEDLDERPVHRSNRRSRNGGGVVPLFEPGYNDKILMREG